MPSESVRERLDALLRDMPRDAWLARDPIAFPRRYPRAADAEIAGLFAAGLAFGRVDLFRPVLARIFAIADAAGGPRAWIESFDPGRDGPALRPIVYRWNRGVDFVLLATALRRIVAAEGGLEPLFAVRPGEGDVGPALIRGVERLRREVVASAAACDVGATTYDALPRGVRMLLPSPSDGSACKRWNMYLRWMARPADGVDLGLWTSVPTRALIVPLDTHVARIARFLGLTARADGSWRTAVEVTAGLRRFDADDPVRYDFAIAHLGISGACKARWEPDICEACALVEVCSVPISRRSDPSASARSRTR
jgi:uncharacterized protein (TIGR02757 family)